MTIIPVGFRHLLHWAKASDMINVHPWVLPFLGLGVVVFSLTPFAAKLKPVQAAGLAGGLLIILITLLPPGKISLWGNSYEPLAAAKAAEVAATGAQLDALSRRVVALEQKITVMSSPTASPAQKAAATNADRKAEQVYQQAKAAADAARRRYLRALSQGALTADASSEPCSQPILNEADGQILTEDGKPLMSVGRDCIK